jgi:hypothetical protein
MDSAVALNLLRACAYWNFKLSDAARKILGEYKKNTAKWALIRAAYTGGDWSGDEKKELSKLME